jgi:hypothetical protein
MGRLIAAVAPVLLAACGGSSGGVTIDGGTPALIAAGGTHSCEVTPAGLLKCWGSNASGESLPPPDTVTAVTVGETHSCALRTDGTAVCWGSNGQGESTPPAGKFVQLSAGDTETCGLRLDGSAVCWGVYTEVPSDAFSQISVSGLGICGVRAADGHVVCWMEQHPLTTFSSLSGAYRSVSTDIWTYTLLVCGITTDNDVECSGDEVAPPAGTFTQVAAGTVGGLDGAFSCGIRTDGTIACWGQPLPGTTPTGTFSQIFVGDGHACALAVGGGVVCWGHDGAGQAQVPAGTYKQVSLGGLGNQGCLLRDDGTAACWTAGTPYFGDPVLTGTYTVVSTGYSHGCEVETGGALSCWELQANVDGEAIPPAGTFTSVVASDTRTCGLLAAGTVQCWGEVDPGETLPPTTGGFTQLVMGQRHGCALKTDGSVSCWGSNDAGQLSVPSTATGFSEIAAAGDYTCGLHTDGSVECWGAGSSQGAPATTDTFVHIAAAQSFLCGLHSDQTVACLATGSTYTQLAVPPTGQFTWIAGGGPVGCGLRANGIVQCWGDPAMVLSPG